MSTTFRDLLRQVKSQIRETTSEEVKGELAAGRKPTLIDVREPDEVAKGVIPGAIQIPRGFLELRIEGQITDRDADIVLYCAAGTRSAFAAKSLGELGYSRVRSLAGGFGAWKEKGFPVEVPRV